MWNTAPFTYVAKGTVLLPFGKQLASACRQVGIFWKVLQLQHSAADHSNCKQVFCAEPLTSVWTISHSNCQQPPNNTYFLPRGATNWSLGPCDRGLRPVWYTSQSNTQVIKNHEHTQGHTVEDSQHSRKIKHSIRHDGWLRNRNMMRLDESLLRLLSCSLFACLDARHCIVPTL